MVQSKKQGKDMWYYAYSACADPGFSPSGGEGVEGPGPPDSKKLGQRCFVIFAVFLVLTFNLFNSFTEGSDGVFLENNNFPRFQSGSNILQGGGRGSNFCQGGGERQMLILVETYQNCDFPRTPYPPSVSAHILPSLVARTQ